LKIINLKLCLLLVIHFLEPDNLKIFVVNCEYLVEIQ
jgi:hypothetical protein